MVISYGNSSWHTLGEYCVISDILTSNFNSSDSKITAILIILDMIPLRAVHDNDSLSVNDIPFVLTEWDVDRLHDH